MEEEKDKKPEEQLTEPDSDFPEALLEYQIERTDAAIDRILSGLRQVEKKNKEYHEKDDLLRREQRAHIRRVLRQIEEEEKERDAKEVVTREDVEESLKATWQYARDKEQLLTDLHSQIEETDQKLAAKRSERDYWLEYINVGSKIQVNKIMNLEKDIQEVKDDLQRNKEYYRNALKAVKEESARRVERHKTLSKEQAPQNAVGFLDKHSRRVIEENEWLKEEIKIYQKEVSDLKASIQLLEEENIGLVTKLIEYRLQNLRKHRHLFLTQAADLQVEFPKDEVEYSGYAAKAGGDESLRSATLPCEENQAFAKIQSEPENEQPQDSDEEPQEMSFTPTLNGLLYEDEKDFQEYLKLSPLETQLMCVVGRAMSIHKELKEMPSRSHREDSGTGKSSRHITSQMIKDLSKEKLDKLCKDLSKEKLDKLCRSHRKVTSSVN